jgi:hypothetical protein
MGDYTMARSLFAELLRMARRDGVIGEVYEHEPEHPLVDRKLYKSEAPFSWGAAAVVDAVDYAQRSWRDAPQRADRTSRTDPSVIS